MIGNRSGRSRRKGLSALLATFVATIVTGDASAYREATEHDTTVAAAIPVSDAAPGIPRSARAPGARARRLARARRATSPAKQRTPIAARKTSRTPRVQITMEPGVTLVDVARTYEIPVSRIMAFNGIRDPRSIHAGRRLVVPGATRVRSMRPRPVCKSAPVKFLRIANDEHADVVLTRCNGQTDPAGLQRLSRLARSLRSSDSAELHPRLLQMLQKIASQFPDKRVEVISGYRPHPRNRDGVSNHTKGRAIDFRVAGVSNEVLRDYCRTVFDDAGVGYYPNSVFIHLDVRDRHAGKSFWVDYSRPGEPPRYGPLLARHAADPEELADVLPHPRPRRRL